MMTQVDAHADELRQLALKVDQLSSDVHDLVDAWKAAKGLVRLVKFLAALAVAYATVWSAFRLGAK